MMPGHYKVEMDGFIYVMKEIYQRIFPLFPSVPGFRGMCWSANGIRFGRIPETEDIIGSVLVKNNEVVPETYQGMLTYRLVTPQGPMKLSSFLLEKLREKLRTQSEE